MAVKNGLLMRKAEAFFNDKQFPEAIAMYEQVTSADPTHVQALTMLAAAHYMTGGLSSAMSNFDKALELDPKSLTALLRSGQLRLQVCNLDRAERDFKTVLEIDGGNQQATEALEELKGLRSKLQHAEVPPCSLFLSNGVFTPSW